MNADGIKFLAHFAEQERPGIRTFFSQCARPGQSAAGVLAGVQKESRRRLRTESVAAPQRRELEKLQALLEAMPEGALALAGEVLLPAPAATPAPKPVATPAVKPRAKPAAKRAATTVPPRRAAPPLGPTTAQLERLLVLGYQGAWPKTREYATEQIQRWEAELEPAVRAERLRDGYHEVRRPTAKQLAFLRQLGYRGRRPATMTEASMRIERLLDRGR